MAIFFTSFQKKNKNIHKQNQLMETTTTTTFKWKNDESKSKQGCHKTDNKQFSNVLCYILSLCIPIVGMSEKMWNTQKALHKMEYHIFITISCCRLYLLSNLIVLLLLLFIFLFRLLLFCCWCCQRVSGAHAVPFITSTHTPPIIIISIMIIIVVPRATTDSIGVNRQIMSYFLCNPQTRWHGRFSHALASSADPYFSHQFHSPERK